MCAVIVIIITKTKPVGNRTVYISNSATDKHNECVRQYNHVATHFNNKLQSKQTEILSCRDKDALDKLMYLVKEFNVEMDYAGDYLNRSNDCLSRNDSAGSGFCVNKSMDILEKMKTIIRNIDLIKPEQQIRLNEPKIRIVHNDKEEMGFFKGCKTKEETDSRYRSLCKAFHPDSKGGDRELFEMMRKEYDSLQIH